MADQDVLTEQPKSGANLLRVTLGVGGVLAIVAGILIMLNPASTATGVALVVAVMFGIYLVVAGIAFLGGAIFTKQTGGWRRVGYALLGVLYIIGGIFSFGNLTTMAIVLVAFLVIFIGVTWIFEGVMAFTTLKSAESKVWAVIYGIISVIAGFTLVFWPLAGGLTLWWLLGIMLIVMGIVQVIAAFRVQTAK